jgi:hypothetical protein
MLHQSVTRNFPTLEQLALLRLREQFPDLRRKGFSAAVRKVCDGELTEHIGIIPDGWLFDALQPDAPVFGIFTAIEIEDHHPLTREKLQRYCDLYDVLDSCNYFLRLLVFDRYGHNQRELDLHTLFFNSLIEMRNSKKNISEEMSDWVRQLQETIAPP